jgi:hypothetical protein
MQTLTNARKRRSRHHRCNIDTGDVQVYGCGSQYIIPVDATMSGTYSNGCFPADRCIDAEQNNSTNITGCASAPLSMCHSDVSQNNSWLQIDLGTPTLVSEVVVINRGDCCQSRIVGFQIGLFAGPDGTMPIGTSQPFTTTNQSYTMSFPMSCAGVNTNPPSDPGWNTPPFSSPTVAPQSAARYVRIYLPSPVAGSIINLGKQFYSHP